MRQQTSADGRGSELEREVESTRLIGEIVALREQLSGLQMELLSRWAGQNRGKASGVSAAVSRTPDVLYATLLGRFAVYRCDRELGIGHNRPVVELGRYLIAHAGRPVPREELLELLWPECQPARAAHRLHVAVSGLRRVLDPADPAPTVVHLDDDSYRIDADAIITDCELFERRYQHGRALLARCDIEPAITCLRAAVALYTGPYLADEPYAEWVQTQRTYFEECQLRALTILCELSAASGDLVAMEEYARAILTLDNLRERAHRHLMRAHYLMGQRAAAIRQYRAWAAFLQQELCAEPAQLTQQLYDAICCDRPLPEEPAGSRVQSGNPIAPPASERALTLV